MLDAKEKIMQIESTLGVKLHVPFIGDEFNLLVKHLQGEEQILTITYAKLNGKHSLLFISNERFGIIEKGTAISFNPIQELKEVNFSKKGLLCNIELITSTNTFNFNNASSMQCKVFSNLLASNNINSSFTDSKKTISKTRAVIAFSLIGVLVLSILSLNKGKDKPQQVPSKNNISPTTTPSTSNTTKQINRESQSLTDFIKSSINNKLGVTTNTNRTRINTIDIEKADHSIFIDLNCNDNISENLIAVGILSNSMNLLKTLSGDTETMSYKTIYISYKYPFTDSSGKVTNTTVSTITINTSKLKPIDWANFTYDMLPGISESYNNHFK